MSHELFSYFSLDDVNAKLFALNEQLPLSKNVDILFEQTNLLDFCVNNRIVFQPIEGNDCDKKRQPSDTTRHRYIKYAIGGPGIIWFETVAVVPQGCGQKKQLVLTEENVGAFSSLVNDIKQRCQKENGYEPLVIIQAGHAGRYSKNGKYRKPIIPWNNPLFEMNGPVDSEYIIGNEELQRLEESYGQFARLAYSAGFDGVDIKSCHLNLINELFSAHERPGPYGGSFENRMRFLVNCFDAAKANTNSGFILTTRMNVFDGFPYPFGFGAKKQNGLVPDTSEPIKIIQQLRKKFNLQLVNLSMGNPFINPHISRPFDHGTYIPNEHPFTSLARIVRCVGEIQKACPNVSVVASSLSYLRQFSPYLASGILEQGSATYVGFGRMALANPNFPRQLQKTKSIDINQVCLACGACSNMFINKQPVSCRITNQAFH
jgi:NADH:flavin oxidoreductases, Old Yellow Enzyme family